ncbi:MAG: hypothetical protein ACQESK_01265 [Bacteroidota bacterium]
MKNLFFLAIIVSILTACQGDNKNKETAQKKVEQKAVKVKSFKGELIYSQADQAAVLKGRDFLHGIKLDSLGNALVDTTETIKTSEFDMVPVLIEGSLIDNDAEDGWEKLIQVRKIVRVYEPKQEEGIEIQSNKEL